MKSRKLWVIIALFLTSFRIEGTLAESLPQEKQRTELVVDYVPEELAFEGRVSTPKRSTPRHSPRRSLKKILRHAMLGFLVILALAGIPVVPPKRIEQDIDNETKTELVEGSEEKN